MTADLVQLWPTCMPASCELRYSRSRHAPSSTSLILTTVVTPQHVRPTRSTDHAGGSEAAGDDPSPAYKRGAASTISTDLLIRTPLWGTMIGQQCSSRRGTGANLVYASYELRDIQAEAGNRTMGIDSPDRPSSTTKPVGHQEFGRIFDDSAEDDDAVVVTGNGRDFPVGGGHESNLELMSDRGTFWSFRREARCLVSGHVSILKERS
jgi:hypothetical protein